MKEILREATRKNQENKETELERTKSVTNRISEQGQGRVDRDLRHTTDPREKPSHPSNRQGHKEVRIQKKTTGGGKEMGPLFTVQIAEDARLNSKKTVEGNGWGGVDIYAWIVWTLGEAGVSCS